MIIKMIFELLFLIHLSKEHTNKMFKKLSWRRVGGIHKNVLILFSTNSYNTHTYAYMHFQSRPYGPSTENVNYDMKTLSTFIIIFTQFSAAKNLQTET